MMRKVFSLIAIGFSFLLFSCDLLRDSPYVVKAWSPGEGFHNDPAAIKISLLFSGESDKVKTEQAFSLTEDREPMKGVFSWEGNRLVFTPASPLEINRDYMITLGTGAQDTKGISLENKFEGSFTTRVQDGKPEVIKTEPGYEGSISGSRGYFRVFFSCAVTVNSCTDFISFSPHTNGSWRLEDENKTACFTPREPWQAGTLYRVKVESGFAGSSGTALGSDYSTVFYAGEDKEKPVLLKALAVVPEEKSQEEEFQDGEPRTEEAEELVPEKSGEASADCYAKWESFTQLELVFSEPVDGSDLRNLLVTEPAVPLVLESSPEPAAVFRFSFAEYPAWGSSFLLRLNPGVKDNAGNESTETYVFRIACAGPLSKPPVFAGIRLPLSPGNTVESPGESKSHEAVCFTPGDLLEDLPIKAGEGQYPFMEKTPTWIELYFETAPGTEIDPFSVMEFFRVESTNRALSFSPESISTDNFTWTNPADGWEEYQRVEISGGMTNMVQSGLVTFLISSGLKDTRGNRSGEDFRISLHK